MGEKMPHIQVTNVIIEAIIDPHTIQHKNYSIHISSIFLDADTW